MTDWNVPLRRVSTNSRLHQSCCDLKKQKMNSKLDDWQTHTTMQCIKPVRLTIINAIIGYYYAASVLICSKWLFCQMENNGCESSNQSLPHLSHTGGSLLSTLECI